MGFLSTVLSRRGVNYRAATPENPSFSLNDPEAWDALTDGAKASSGVQVNAESALTYSPWWRGVNLIARTVGRVPLHTYRKDGTSKTLAIDHAAYFLLRRKPNPYQTALQFRQQLTGHALSRGNGYALIDRDPHTEIPTALWPLDPTSVTPIRERGTGHRWIVVSQDGGTPVRIEMSHVLHVKGLSYDGFTAYSVVNKAKEHLGLGMGGVKYQAIFFKNGARPAVVLETPHSSNEKVVKDVVSMWDRMTTGLDNMHRTAVLWNGLQAKTLSFNADDSKIIDTRNLSARDVANFLGLPIHKVGDTSRTAYASLEQENMSCLDEAYDPWLCEWEEECWDKLLREDEKLADSHEIEFDRDRLVRGDSTSRSTYFRAALGGAPWMTRNEVRGEEGLNPIDGGDEIIDPKNMGDNGGADNQPKDPAESNVKPSSSASFRPLVMDTARRAVRRLSHAAAAAAKQPQRFVGAVDALAANHLGAAVSSFEPVAVAAGGRFKALDVSQSIFARVKDALLDVAGECNAAELEGRVSARMLELETELPAEVADVALGANQ